MTSIRMHQRDDAEVGLLESDREDEDDVRTQPNNLWPRDMIGRNLNAKMGTVASEKVSIRLGFLRKVFGILSFQIVLTTAICAALYATPGVQDFVKTQ
ncbi:unnamed protein product [Auanema sp. JU1783]|nr:unnamed protein product [Auanema sp. JU1783]